MSDEQFDLRKTAFILVPLALALTALVYGSAVRLPLYSDDLLQVPWTQATPMVHFWYQEGPYGDYRPLHYTLWRLLFLMTGDLSPALLHSLPLAGHALCGLLVGLLTAQWSRKLLPAALTTALFTLAPFAFDAVLWVSSFSYPLTTALALGALLVYNVAREKGHRKLHLGALVLTALAALAYEGGVVTGALIFLYELLRDRHALSRWAWGHVAVSAAAVLLISGVSSSVPTEYLTGIHPTHNLVIALQCFTFPVAPLAMIGTRLGIRPYLLMVPLGLLTLIGLTILCITRRQGKEFLFGMGWAALWSLLPVLSQPFNWFRDPPRAFYPAAAGIALGWTAALSALWEPWERRAPARHLLLSAAVLLPAFIFLRHEVALYARTGDLLWDVIETAQAAPGTLFINLPGRITPEKRFYPLGHEGVIPIPPPTDTELLVAIHTGQEGQIKARSMGGILPSLPLDIEPADPPVSPDNLRAAAQIVAVTYQTTTLGLEAIGKVMPAQPQGEAADTFGDILALRDASCRWEDADRLIIAIEWQSLSPLSGQPAIFTHWLGPDGKLVAQADGEPLRGLYPLSQWKAGDVVQETRIIEGVSRQSQGTVAIGVWDPGSGQRLPALDAEGKPLPDQALRIEECTP